MKVDIVEFVENEMVELNVEIRMIMNVEMRIVMEVLNVELNVENEMMEMNVAQIGSN